MTPLALLDAVPLAAALPLAALLGLAAGSFIATLVLRWGAGRSIGGRSGCDGCGRPLTVVELVPLLGAIIARGRCRSCGAAINPFHRNVELAAAAIAVVSLLLLPGVAGWCLALFGLLMLPLALLDARHFWLPDPLVGVLAIVGLLLGGPLLGTTLTDRLAGAIAAGLSLAVLAFAFRRLRGRDGMGAGDPKLAAALGAWLGWMALPLLFLLASGGGLIWALATAKKNVPISDRHIPFGTFLAGAAWLAVPLWPLISGR